VGGEEPLPGDLEPVAGADLGLCLVVAFSISFERITSYIIEQGLGGAARFVIFIGLSFEPLEERFRKVGAAVEKGRPRRPSRRVVCAFEEVAEPLKGLVGRSLRGKADVEAGGRATPCERAELRGLRLPFPCRCLNERERGGLPGREIADPLLQGVEREREEPLRYSRGERSMLVEPDGFEGAAGGGFAVRDVRARGGVTVLVARVRRVVLSH